MNLFKILNLDTPDSVSLSCITRCPDEANTCQEKYDPDDADYGKHGIAAVVIYYPDAGKN